MKTILIEGEKEINVKRFYLPVKVDVECPHCGEKHVRDFSVNYLSYPKINKRNHVYVYCESCDGEFEFDATLKVSLEVDTTTRPS